MLRKSDNEIIVHGINTNRKVKELGDKQVSQFWTRHNVNVSKDLTDYKNLHKL